ncbi:polysaccharide biosynthesis/export family protein [Thiorhodovibrio litoralis]|uniref:polysaccharide biosynthesis/export family protein n=1 Tax=Thiorhodovibrio litoralis TaxID=2952932 RepID=UPI002B259C18|nr:polysaccharide biosynthesis/export family protein [Thiorhodovibrio litoralis]WPL11516.1 Polysialic acid transport protein KpsD precursor [Thiorhodovibrio litoralis]
MKTIVQAPGRSPRFWIPAIVLIVAFLLPHVVLAQGEDYLLGPGDKVRVTVFGEPYLSGEFIVSAGGSIAMPLIQPIEVNNRTVVEAQQLVEQALRAGFVGEPKVSVEILEYRPFFVIGEVKSPGSYPYVADMTVLHAVAIAGGFTPRAAKSKIAIQRDGKELGSVQNNTRVMPDDVITVKERFF